MLKYRLQLMLVLVAYCVLICLAQISCRNQNKVISNQSSGSQDFASLGALPIQVENETKVLGDPKRFIGVVINKSTGEYEIPPGTTKASVQVYSPRSISTTITFEATKPIKTPTKDNWVVKINGQGEVIDCPVSYSTVHD